MRTATTFKTLITLVIGFAMTTQVKAQCTLSVTPGTNVSINCGQSVQLEAFGLSSQPALSTDFNNLQLGAGWSTTAILQYNNPCSPSLDGTPSVWYGNVPLPRTLETNAFDVSCGGTICFDLDFGADDFNSNNCEDPDLPNEGVFIQYSTDGGITWDDIFYFQPTPDKSGPYYDWANYCFNIPPGGWSSSTRFRWFQAAATNVVFDHWGIDNVVITPAVCGGVYDWSHLAGTNDPATTTVAPTSTTDYTVTYSDSIGNVCTETITVTVVGLEDPGQDSTVTLCDVDGALNVFSALGGTPDAGGTWVDVDGSGALTGVFFDPTTAGAGVYNFDYIVSGLCNTDTSTVTVTVEATANAGIDGTISLCAGDTPTQAELFAELGGSPDAGGVWSGPVMGVYTYTVTTSGACPSTDMANVILNELPFDIEVTATPIDCHGDSTTISVVALAGTAPFVGLGTFVEAAGMYDYTVTDANGCTTTESITVNQPDPLVISAVVDTLTCTGGVSTTLVVTASGGVGPYVGTGTFNEGIGTYIYVVEDANKCEDSVTVTVTEPPSSPVILSFSATPIACSGGTSNVTVSASGGMAPYTGTGNFPVSAGTHVFSVVDANGCTFTDSVTVTEPSPVIASGTVVSVPCTNAGTGTVVITATGGNSPYTGTGSFTAGVGTQTYVVTDANGCTDEVTLTVSPPVNPVAISISTTPIACNGGTGDVTVSATGGATPYTGTGTFTVSPGTYYYSVVDANGCSSADTVIVTQPTQLVPSATSTAIICNGGTSDVTVTATGGTPGYTGTGVFTVTAGTHDFPVTDANGCTEIVSITVTEPAPLVVLTSPDSLPCNGQGTALVVVSATGGTWPYTGTGLFNETIGTYTYLITDANGCTATGTATVGTISSPVVVSLTSTSIDCNGGTSDITVSASGGAAPYTGTGTFTVTAGTYNYTVTDANLCSTTESITVTEPAPLVASVSATSIDCNGGTADIIVSATGGTAAYSGTGTFTVSAGTYDYTVTDANGCTDMVSITVTEPAPLVVSVTADSVPCGGGTAAVVVTATGGTAPLTGTGTFNETAGTYTYDVTDANGCTESVTVTVFGSSSPVVVSLTATSIDCPGGTADVSVSASGGDAPYTGTGTFSVSAGTYVYTVTDANGCSATDSITVTEADLIPPTALCQDLSIDLDANGNATITVSNNQLANSSADFSGTQGANGWSYGHYLAYDAGNFIPLSFTGFVWNNPGVGQPLDFPQLDPNGGHPASNNLFWAVRRWTSNFTGNINISGDFYDRDVNCGDGANVRVFQNGVQVYEYLNIPGSSVPYSIPLTVSAGDIIDFAIDPKFDFGCDDTHFTASISGAMGIDNGSFDNCGIDSLLISQSTFDCSDIGDNLVTLTVVDLSGNSSSCTATVTVNDNSAPSAICQDLIVALDANGNASITAGDVDNGSTDNCGIDSLSVSPSTFDCSNIGANTVTLTVVDNSGNTSTCTANVAVNDNIAPTAICQDITVTLDASGNASVTANDINNGSSDNCGAVVASISAGTTSYTCADVGQTFPVTLLVTDANGNTSTCVAQVTVGGSPIVASISATTIDCNGGTADITVSATGGTAPYTGTGTFTVTAGTYDYTVTDASGCSETLSITVTEPTALSASISATSIDCNGGTADITVSATGGTGPYTGTGTFTVTAGTYDYTVTDANGCSETVSITVTEPTALSASISATSIDCNGGTADITVSATGGTAPYTGTGTFTVTAGTYDYTVTDANGCSETVSISVTEPTALVASISGTSIDCNGGTADITVSATGGTPSYTGTGTFTVTAGTYDYTVTDANGCSETVSITVTEPTSLSASISATSIDCNGGTADVTVTATGGTPSYTGTGTFTVTAGTYDYTVTDANGCSETVSITVTEPAAWSLTATATEILCNGATADITVVASGGAAPYTGTGTFTGLSAGTYTYTVTDANGCSQDVTITVTEPALLTATISSTGIACNGGTADIIVMATGGTAPYTGTGTYNVGAGTYFYTVTDANGCSVVTDSITITEPTLMTAYISCPIIECNGGTADMAVFAFGGTPPYTGGGLFNVGAGSYTYTMTDANGCTSTVSYTVTEPAPIIVTVTATGTPCPGCTDVTVTASGGDAPYTGLGTFTLTSPGVYSYTVTDANGCTGTGSILVGGGGGGLDGMQITIGAAGKDSELNMRKATIAQYPNPASTSATFEFTVPVKEMVTLSIVNLRGELIGTIFSEEVEADQPRLVKHDISELESGIYFIHMNTDEGTLKKKFVVLK